MTEYDIPWKEILDVYLREFLELCLPAVHEGIDWNYPIENQEQELPHLFPDSQAPGRIADKLFRARFKDSTQPTWVLIHTEVQVQRVTDFPKRMFTCYYRILDRFQEPVVCIGVIADVSKTWRPDIWLDGILGCEVRFVYPVVKLQDFSDRIHELESSSNPFATVILSHLLSQASSDDQMKRFQFKMSLVRRLYEKNWEPEQVRNLFRFIDWVMDLGGGLEVQFRDKVRAIEMEKQMPYITSIERLARVEGKAEGKAEGKIQLFQEVLGLPVMQDSELESRSTEQLERLLAELRQQYATRNG